MRIRNLTPHSIDIIGEHHRTRIPPEQHTVPRIIESAERTGHIEIHGIDVALLRVTPSHVVDLPPPEENTLLIVARVIADSARERHDLVVPYDTVRDADGTILGCRSLAHISTTTPGPHKP